MYSGLIGIDFGAENSLVAVTRHGIIEVAVNEVSNRKTPSYIVFSDRKRVIGDSAYANLARNWRNTAYNMKNLLGKYYSKRATQYEVSKMKAAIVAAPDNSVSYDILCHGKQYRLRNESATAMILDYLRKCAEKHANMEVIGCVVATPCFYTIKQKLSLLAAAEIVGLNVQSFISEQAAAALNYGITKDFGDEIRHVLFMDMGHTSVGMAVVEFKKNQGKVLCCDWSDQLGSREFDNAIKMFLAQEIRERYGIQPLDNPKSAIKLQKAAKKAKETLCLNRETKIYIECLMDDIDISVTIDRDKFDHITSNLVENIVGMVGHLIKSSGIEMKKIHSLEFLGGGTRLIKLKESLKIFFGRTLSFTCNPDESVANGATLRCAMISSVFRVKKFNMIDCFPFTVRIRWGKVNSDFLNYDSHFENSAILFPRFSPIPSKKIVSFGKNEPFQIVMIYDNMDELPIDSDHFIARYIIHPKASHHLSKNSSQKVKVTISIDIYGRILVTKAEMHESYEEMVPVMVKIEEKDEEKKGEKDNEVEQTEAKAKPVMEKRMEKKVKTQITALEFEETIEKLTRENIDEAIKVEKNMCAIDEKIQEKGRLRNNLERYIIKMNSSIDTDLKPFVHANISRSLKQELKQAGNWLYSSEADRIEATDAIKQKHQNLLDKGNPISRRKKMHENFVNALNSLEQTVGNFEAEFRDAQRGLDDYSHMGTKEIEVVGRQLHKARKYLEEIKGKKRGCALYEDFPNVQEALINMKKTTSSRCKPLLSKEVFEAEAAKKKAEKEKEKLEAEAAGAKKAKKEESESKKTPK